MRRWAVQFWEGASRSILEVSAENQDAALQEARYRARALAYRLEEWANRAEAGQADVYETAMGAAIYNDWGPKGYQGQPFGADQEAK